MAIKYLSINNEILDIDNIPKLDSNNVFTRYNTFQSNSEALLSLRRDLNLYTDTNERNNLIEFSDKEKHIFGRCGFYKDSTITSMEIRISDCYNQDSASIAILGLRQDLQTGRTYTRSSAQLSSNSNGSELATTQWVRTLLKSLGLNA